MSNIEPMDDSIDDENIVRTGGAEIKPELSQTAHPFLDALQVICIIQIICF
jgi:hypothetical protein